MTFFEELKRRRVVRVLLVYLASGFAFLEAVDLLVAALSLPPWLLQATIAILAVGLPVTLALSWVYDITPEGVVQTDSESALAAETSTPGRTASSSWLSLGSFTLAVLLVTAGALGTWLFESITAGSTLDAASNSIAVLPFSDVGSSTDDRFFTDGLHEDLITRLSRLSGVTVISRASVLEYSGEEGRLDEIARELGVATLLLGTVRRTGDQVRVSVELVDPATRESRWADSYDRTIDDVFEIQADIATSISQALKASLSPQERSVLNERPTDDIEAYRDFVRGAEVLTRAIQTLDPRGLAGAVESLERAVGLDAGFALAHAYLSVALEWSGRATAQVEQREALRARARDSAREALQLKPELPEANFAMALQGSSRPGDRARTEQDIVLLQSALDGLPNNAAVLRELALRFERLGRVEEAVEYSAEAAQREPRSALFQLQAANHAGLIRDFDRAGLHLSSAMSIASDTPIVSEILYRLAILFALADGGGGEAAKEVFGEELRVTDPAPSRIGARLTMFPELLRGGDHDELLERLASEPDGGCTCYEARAWLHTLSGRAEAARAAWDSAAVERLSVTEWPDALGEALHRATTAAALARAGRNADAREQLEALSALGPEALEAPAGAIRREDWRDIRVVRAEAYAALGDAAAAAQILSELLARPTGVTLEYLEARLAWDPIRDDPAFVALFER